MVNSHLFVQTAYPPRRGLLSAGRRTIVTPTLGLPLPGLSDHLFSALRMWLWLGTYPGEPPCHLLSFTAVDSRTRSGGGY